MSETSKLRALSLVAGYSAVMEDDYSAVDLCDLGRETMDWIIENTEDSDRTITHEDDVNEGERILLELGIIDKPGQFAERQVSEL